MNKQTTRLIMLFVCCCLATTVSGKELLQEFKGSSGRTTPEFEVTAPWVLDWRVTSEFQKSLGFQVDLVDAKSGEYLGKVVTTKWINNGVRLFDQSGRFRFEVSSNFANWTLRVEKLTRQEAESYTPKHGD